MGSLYDCFFVEDGYNNYKVSVLCRSIRADVRVLFVSSSDQYECAVNTEQLMPFVMPFLLVLESSFLCCKNLCPIV